MIDPPREELINGQIVTVPSRDMDHHFTTQNITYTFGTYLKKRDEKTCRYFGWGLELELTEKDHFIPDGMLICNQDQICWDCIQGAPGLVVEVLSLSTEKLDRGYKKDVYERTGVGEYWIVCPYPGNLSIEVYLLKDGRFVLDNIYRYYPDCAPKDLLEEERALVVSEFRCNLFDDLPIRLADVFEDLGNYCHKEGD